MKLLDRPCRECGRVGPVGRGGDTLERIGYSLAAHRVLYRCRDWEACSDRAVELAQRIGAQLDAEADEARAAMAGSEREARRILYGEAARRRLEGS